MEVDTEQSVAAQMEANTYQEDHVIKSKEAQAHAVERETTFKKGLENPKDAKGVIHNGE